MLARFQACLQALGQRPVPERQLALVLDGLAEPHRAYHTEQHIRECLQLFDAYRDHADAAHEVEFSIWMHDAIYDPTARDNEARSAEWAARLLSAADADDALIDRVTGLIIATKHDAAPEAGTDSALLVDIDLAILGASPQRYREYCAQVRFEYAHVPDDAWQTGRAAVLRQFLSRAVLYQTPALHDQLDIRARHNLRLELRDL